MSAAKKEYESWRLRKGIEKAPCRYCGKRAPGWNAAHVDCIRKAKSQAAKDESIDTAELRRLTGIGL